MSKAFRVIKNIDEIYRLALIKQKEKICKRIMNGVKMENNLV